MSLEERLDYGKKLSRQHHWHELLEYAQETGEQFNDPHAWMQVVLAACNLNLPEDVIEGWMKHVRLTADDVQGRQFEGDCYRDRALGYIRRGELDKVPSLIEEAQRLHSGDENRQAVLLAAKARYFFMLGYDRMGLAREMHARADLMWTILEREHAEGDRQWRFNNWFHWLVTANRSYRPLLSLWLAARIMRNCRRYGSAKHRLAVATLLLPEGWRLVRRIMR